MMQVHVRHEDAYNEYTMVLFHRHPIPIKYDFANFIVPHPHVSCSVQKKIFPFNSINHSQPDLEKFST